MTESTDTMTICQTYDVRAPYVLYHLWDDLDCRRTGSSSSSNIVNLLVVAEYQQKYVNNNNGLFYDDQQYLTLLDLPLGAISAHNLRVFDELSHQYNAVLHSSNSPLLTIGINNFHSSYLMPITMNDYERRFQRSLQKLSIPTWYTDTIPPSNLSSSSKQSILSTSLIPWKSHYRETQRTPEIIHIHRPHSYRSCRSSVATSPSPSIHSWHPNHIMDGMNFSLLIPSASRKHHKYQKGIERVSKSSQWYQPTPFPVHQSTKNPTGIRKISTSTRNSHYDTPKIYNLKENIISNSNSLVTNGDVAKLLLNKQNNNMITNDKQQDNHMKSNESAIMPLANPIELEEIITEEDDKRSFSMPQIDQNELLERAANDLVESVLADILLLQNLADEDQNSGVRELSEDENGLRELDENDMNDTDEFIVFGTKADHQTTDNPRYNLNRLYTFSKTNDDPLKQINTNQNSSSVLLENYALGTHANLEQPFDKLFHTSPIYQLHYEKQHINLEKYIDRMTCPSKRHLSTQQSFEGVNEETARIGRVLLDSLPSPLIENFHHLSHTSTSPRMILKNTQFVESPRDYYQQGIIEEYDEGLHDKVRRDSAYSSNQERIHIHQSIYEPLSECYSGYSYIQSDFLTPTQTTTDEAYESEPTTMSSSIATTTHVHPDLEHEFEYPTPPPPVPDRRLKPAYLKSSPPPTKPRSTKQNHLDSLGYSIIQKTKPLPITSIPQFLISTSNNSTSPSTRTRSSRHYCGSIPISNDITQSSINSTSIKTNEQFKDKIKEKRTSRTLNCLHPSTTDDNQKRNVVTKSSSSLNKTKIKKVKLMTDFDEATNGLAIRLPAPISNGYEFPNKQNLHKTSTKRANVMTKNRQIIDHIKLDRPSFYETSV